ncbi:MAG: redox-regulated ATPase YchF [Chloroflexi bacterium RBG_13_51_18]|nr:MAG: redox-regulated ATPase YchF [Chloroflexi bacterium RBG_13_51_18]
MNIGIIGLSQSGKTTVFSALTGGKADTKSHTTDGLSPHIGIAHVPEPRLKVLADLFHPPKVVFSEAKYVDIGASVKSLVTDKGIGGQLLNQLSTVDTLMIIIRAFEDESVAHPQGSLDIKRDINTLNLELVFSDLTIMERRLEKLETSLKAAKPGERQVILQEKEILLGFQTELQNDKPLRTLAIESAAAKLIANYQFLTAKPVLIVVNIDEKQIPQAASMEADLKTQFSDAKCRVITLCAKLEMELVQLDENAAQEFRDEYGLKESGLERTIKMSYELSDMITFFTIGQNEVRAWSIVKGTTALKAAGKIHTDMEKGFIRAECIGLNELVECGSIAEARKKGLLRLEGKEYIIRDGDVVTVLFNV